MRRLYLRLRCALGLHNWFYQTTADPERFECRRCSACGRWQVREQATLCHHGERVRFGWGPWEPYEPQPEPWGADYY